MKLSLLLVFFVMAVTVQAQSVAVTRLPVGTYQVQDASSATFKGNIVLIDDSHYRLSTETTIGDYKFSATAQRILFLSGTLKGAFARAASTGSETVIALPLKENEETGFKLIQADLQAFYKKN
jgi:hypothetical protein